jgi:hypothetical protein
MPRVSGYSGAGCTFRLGSLNGGWLTGLRSLEALLCAERATLLLSRTRAGVNYGSEVASGGALGGGPLSQRSRKKGGAPETDLDAVDFHLKRNKGGGTLGFS